MLAAPAQAMAAGWYSMGSISTFTGPDQLNAPTKVARAADGSLYVLDTGASRVVKFDASGAYLTTFGTSGPGLLSSPAGIAVDASGNVLVADAGNNRVATFTSAGAFSTSFGTAGDGMGELNAPQAVAVAGDGSIFVADTGNDRVEKFTAAGSYVGQFGGTGTADGEMEAPGGVVVGADGSIYVADTGNHRIQKFTSAAVFVARWGTAGSALGQYNAPTDITELGDGTLLVADSGNHRILQVTDTGEYVNSFGTAGTGAGQLSWPRDAVAIDSANIAVVEEGAGRLSFWGLDTTAPTSPPAVWDGVGDSDTNVVSSASSMSVRWTAATDTGGSGVAAYEYCVTVSVSCGGAPLVNWARVAPMSGFTLDFPFGMLASGVTYRFCIRTVDFAENRSGETCSNGQMVDVTPPPAPRVVRDGLFQDVGYFGRGQLSASWDAVTDQQSGTTGYEYCIARRPGCAGGVLVGWTSVGSALSFKRTIPTSALRNGTTYFTCVRTVDAAGFRSPTPACSDGQAFDQEPPVLKRRTRQLLVTAGVRRLTLPIADMSRIQRMSSTLNGRRVDSERATLNVEKVRDGRGILRVTAYDAVGNSSRFTFRMLIDRMAPKVRPKARYVMAPTVKLLISDRTSGVKVRSKTVRLKRPGKRIVRIRVRDRAGNSVIRKVEVWRRLSLATPTINRDLRGAPAELSSASEIDAVFAFRRGTARPPTSRHSRLLVKEVQWRLRLFGFLPKRAPITGQLNAATLQAAAAFQSRAGVKSIGTIGPQTRKALDKALLRYRR